MANGEQQGGQEHAPGEGDILGMAIGFRIFEDGGDLYLAEAEISPYEDEPTALGVTLVFHPLAGVDPTQAEDEDTEPWIFDFDDELTRDSKASIADQTQNIFRQLGQLSEASLREYLRASREDEGGGNS